MKLWILKAREDLSNDESPWEPWYDKYFGFVVRAPSEARARELAQENAGDEKWGRYIKEERRAEVIPAWLEEKYSTCEVLTVSGAEGILLADFHAA